MFTFPAIDMAKTGQKIMDLRMKSGMTVKDIQDVFGFTSPQAVYKWQHGSALPSVDNLVVLAAIFHVKIDDILVISDEQVRNIA